MFKLIKIAAVVISLGLLALPAQPASASLSYQFVQTSGTPDWLNVEIEYTIADETGVNAKLVSALNPQGWGGTLDGSLDNLLAFRFSGGGTVMTLDRLHQIVENCETTLNIFCGAQIVFDLDLTATTASAHYLDLGDQFAFGNYFGLGPDSGIINSDPHMCQPTGLCHFTGYFVAVPEPATLAMFGIGLFAVAATRRKTIN